MSEKALAASGAGGLALSFFAVGALAAGAASCCIICWLDSKTLNSQFAGSLEGLLMLILGDMGGEARRALVSLNQ